MFDQKTTKINKKIQSIQKKLAMLEKKNEDTTKVKKDLKKAKMEMSVDQFPCKDYIDYMALTRLQSGEEWAQKFARAKALQAAVASAECQANEDEDCEKPFGLQAAKKHAATNAGFEMMKKIGKKKESDKALKDIFKVGSHLLK